MLNENKIEELKQRLVEEIGLEKTKNVSTQKAILNLSKSAEKEQRSNNFKQYHKYVRSSLAGAYYIGNETMICNGFYGVIFNGKIEGLQMIPDYQKQEESGTCFDLHKVITSDVLSANKKEDYIYNISELKNELKVLKATKQNLHTTINSATYNLESLINLLECFENCKIYNNPTNNLSQLIFEGDNGIGILLPLRPQK